VVRLLTTDALRRGGPLRGEDRAHSSDRGEHAALQACPTPYPRAGVLLAQLVNRCGCAALAGEEPETVDLARGCRTSVTSTAHTSLLRKRDEQHFPRRGIFWPGGLGISQQRPIRIQIVVKTTQIQRSPGHCGDHTIRGDFSGFSCRKASISVSGRPPNNLRWNGVHWESIPSPRSQTRGTLVGTDVEAVQSTAHGASPEPSHW
jgi:hypothetical protein